MEFQLEENGLAGSELSLALRQLLRQNLLNLPLERFCEKGGYPLHPRIERMDWSGDRESAANVHLLISFNEVGAACCSGECFENNRLAEFDFRFEPASGVVALLGD